MRTIAIIGFCFFIVGIIICGICIGINSIGPDVDSMVITWGAIIAIGGWIVHRKFGGKNFVFVRDKAKQNIETATLKPIARDKVFTHVDTEIASFDFSIGHWQETGSGRIWIANKVGDHGIWDFKSEIKYLAAKSAHDIFIHAVARDTNDAPYADRVFWYKNTLKEGETYTHTWTPCWVGKSIGRIDITKISFSFSDGTRQEIEIKN
ncbi:MAG: hypothetical protein E7444_05885 [Ruminococcaceae bacterium]|nr:hypothetical protein [Oscillospiraceae bacterium]